MAMAVGLGLARDLATVMVDFDCRHHKENMRVLTVICGNCFMAI